MRQGQDRILIQVPGIGSAEELKQLIGTTAKLTFNPVVGRTTDANTRPGTGNVILPSMDEDGVFYVIEEKAVVTGEDLTDARPSFDQNGEPSVDFRFGPCGMSGIVNTPMRTQYRAKIRRTGFPSGIGAHGDDHIRSQRQVVP